MPQQQTKSIAVMVFAILLNGYLKTMEKTFAILVVVLLNIMMKARENKYLIQCFKGNTYSLLVALWWFWKVVNIFLLKSSLFSKCEQLTIKHRTIIGQTSELFLNFSFEKNRKSRWWVICAYLHWRSILELARQAQTSFIL